MADGIEDETPENYRSSGKPTKRGINPLRMLCRAVAGIAFASQATVADAGATQCVSSGEGFHPLHNFGFGFFYQIDSNCVGVVKRSGALQPEPLLPGLSWRPWAYFGEYIRPVLAIPDTDTYGADPRAKIVAQTKDHIPYHFVVSVTNQVLPEDIVEVVRLMGLEYDQKDLKMVVHNAVKEVVKSLGWMDIERDRANDLNELFADEIRTSLKQKFGDKIGGKIRILSTTVQEKLCQSPSLTLELQQQAEHEAKAQTEVKKRAAELETFKTIEQKDAAEHKKAESARKAQADREEQDALAAAKKQQIQNDQKVANAKAEANAAQLMSDQKVAALRAEAEVFEKSPAYAGHLVALKRAEAMQGIGTKLVVSTDMFDKGMGAVSGWATTVMASGINETVCRNTGMMCSGGQYGGAEATDATR